MTHLGLAECADGDFRAAAGSDCAETWQRACWGRRARTSRPAAFSLARTWPDERLVRCLTFRKFTRGPGRGKRPRVQLAARPRDSPRYGVTQGSMEKFADPSGHWQDLATSANRY
jgi:hypothetical protein